MSYLRKVVPTSRISDAGGVVTLVEGTPIGLLLVLTYAHTITSPGVANPPVSRIKKEIKS